MEKGESSKTKQAIVELQDELLEKLVFSLAPKEAKLNSLSGDERKNWESTAVAKFFCKRWIPLNIIAINLQKQWKTTGNFQIKTISNGIFSISFSNKIDLQFVLQNGPWNVQGYIFSIHEWVPNLNIEEVKFHFVPCWVQAFGLPLEWQKNKEDLETIGNTLGFFKEADVDCCREFHAPVVRIKIVMNIKKQLSQQVKLDSGDPHPLHSRLLERNLAYNQGLEVVPINFSNASRAFIAFHGRANNSITEKVGNPSMEDSEEVQVNMVGGNICMVEAYVSNTQDMNPKASMPVNKEPMQVNAVQVQVSRAMHGSIDKCPWHSYSR
ncbi:hypothetical protein IFM89_032613 [Coptis chinensis]|uniref:DUF4283 domain-containing protein n=1 Tax=Coptis chinensis TaxID=261450 RepID=A0A835IU41_9MAGN|nr:hypothetical protein IFM89_032613 [Coptis chinensis]